MGMAASQARLLSLTSRLHDIELKAQNIQSQKIALATQKDELYQDYCDALDATSIKAAFYGVDGSNYYMDANFSTLCNYSENRCVDYALVNNRSGMLIVSEEAKRAYDRFGHTDKYAFAWAMLGMENNLSTVTDTGDILAQLGVNTSAYDYSQLSINDPTMPIGNGDDLYMTDVEYTVFKRHYGSDATLTNAYDNLIKAKDDTEQRAALKTFREALYSSHSGEIFNAAKVGNGNNSSGDDWSKMSKEFNYYVNLWEAINQAGGCEAIEKGCESGEKGNAWFNNMVNAGLVGIKYFDRSDSKEWSDTSIATSTNHNYLKEEQDEKDLKKAEAAYEHGLSLINKKDTKFDTELSKLETERTAITTEMESISKVRDENIERTFGIFS